MTGLRERVDAAANHSHYEEIVARLGRGEGSGGAAAADVVAALAFAGLGGDLGPSLVRSSPSRPALLSAASEPAMAALLPRAKRPDRLALSAGLLQVLDFWGESHEAAQEADDLGESAFSPYWHAIAHRREPDPGNAGYWFRRVGRHPSFAALAEVVRPLLDAHGDPGLSSRLLKGGAWDPTAFVAFCGSAREGSEAERLARRIQRAEMLVLLDAAAALTVPERID